MSLIEMPAGDATQPSVATDTQKLYEALGPIPDLGAGDAQLGWPLLSWLDGLGQILQRIDDLASDTPDAPGWSILLDVDRCPTYALPWLAQCVGVRFDPTQVTDAAQRAAIGAEQGFNRGTAQAIQSAAQKYLAAGQFATVFERDTDPYHLTVVLTLGQLAPATYSQVSATYTTYAAWTAATSSYSTPAYPEAALTAAVAAQKPAGLIMAVNITVGAPYGTTSADYTTYSAWTAADPTYQQAILDTH